MRRGASGLLAIVLCSTAASPSLAMAPASELSERLFELELSRYMATKCRKLDRSGKASSAYGSALRNYSSVVADAKKTGRAAFVAAARRRLNTASGEVDTSCIVGPQETPRMAYASLLSDFGHATNAVRHMLSAQARSN